MAGVMEFLGWIFVFFIIFTLFPPLGMLMLMVFALGLIIMIPIAMVGAVAKKPEEEPKKEE